jgi:hypothetical protein
MASIGDSFLLGAGGHLWIIITQISAARTFVMVNVTSLDDEIEDTSCILREGDHRWITHDSVVTYKDAREWSCDGNGGYDLCLAQQRIVPHDRVSADVLRRIQEGALASEFTKNKFRSEIQSSLISIP